MSKAIAGTVSRRTKPTAGTLFRLGRISVRQFLPTDYDALTQAANDARVARTLLLLPHPYRRVHAERWVRLNRRRYQQPNARHQHFAIAYDNQVIGGIGSDRHGREAVFGYWLAPEFWGRGIMTQVVKHFVPFVWRWWPVERLLAQVFTFNPASGRVLEKSGFTHAAFELRAVRKGARWFDVHVYTRNRRTSTAGSTYATLK